MNIFLRRYKKQIEDAEEIAALNLVKFRKAQQQLEEAEERTQTAENHMGRLRHERGASLLVSDCPFKWRHSAAARRVTG